MITLLPYQGIWPQIDPQAFIAPTAVIIGDVHIGAYTGIWYGCVVRGDVHQIRIGSYTNIQDGTVIHVTQGGQGTHIGNHITVGHMSLIHDCTLESGCFVGMKACVMDYARVESGAMVAAGALVTPRKISAELRPELCRYRLFPGVSKTLCRTGRTVSNTVPNRTDKPTIKVEFHSQTLWIFMIIRTYKCRMNHSITNM